MFLCSRPVKVLVRNVLAIETVRTVLFDHAESAYGDGASFFNNPSTSSSKMGSIKFVSHSGCELWATGTEYIVFEI